MLSGRLRPALSHLTSLALASGLLSGCTMKQLVADNMVGLMEEIEAEFLAQPSYAYGREAGASLLLMLDGVVASSPDNKQLLEIGARMNGQFALAFAEDEDPVWARSHFRKGLEYGLRALDDPALEDALEGHPDQLRSILAHYDVDDVPLLFWTGFCYGGLIDKQRDSVRAVANLPNAKVVMERCIELDEGFFNGAPWLWMARYHGRGGVELGGDPAAALAAAQRSWELSGERLLLARVYVARYVAVPTQDRELFESVLWEVLDAPEGMLPGEDMVNAVAAHMAEELLFNADDYFLGGPR